MSIDPMGNDTVPPFSRATDPEVASRFDALLHLEPGALVSARGQLCELVQAPQVDDAGDVAVLLLRPIAEHGSPREPLPVVIGRSVAYESVTPTTLPGVFSGRREVAAFQEWRALALALRLAAVGAGDRPLSLQDARIEIEWYQYEPVIKALRQRVPRMLIADDVGLGKTIEAGIVLMELHARRCANRVLVIVPANLQYQWRDELWEKFGLRFRVFDREGIAVAEGELEVGENPWKRQPWIVASLDLIKDKAHRRTLTDDPDLRWDLIIIDEAHHVAPQADESGKTRDTLRSQLARSLAERTDALLLLTATPHDGYRQSFTALLNLLDPSLLPNPNDISAHDREVVQRHFVRRLKAWILDESGARTFPPRLVETIEVWMQEDEQKLYRAIARHIDRKRKLAEKAAKDATAAEDKKHGRIAAFAMEVLKKRLGSSWGAIAHSLDARLKRKQEELTKATAKLTEQQAALVHAEDIDADSEALADGVELPEKETDEAEERLVQAVGATRDEIEELRRLAARTRKLVDKRSDAKVDELATLLSSIFDGTCSAEGATVKADRVVVFTEYLATRDHIFERLKREPWANGGDSIALMQGGMSRRRQREAFKQFAQGRLLLATDAISEGINLQQYAHVVIHAEIPWNPNRLEQRNGRVDRKGQTKPVVVFNLLLAGSYEGRVLGRVLMKLDEIRKDVGSTNAVIGRSITRDAFGPMVREEDIRDRLRLGDVEDIAAADVAAADVISDMESRAREVREYQDRTGLFATVFGPNEIAQYRRSLASLRPDAVLAADVEEYVVRRLQSRGLTLRPDPRRARCWLPWSEGAPGLDWARDSLRPNPDEPESDDNPVRPFTFDREIAVVTADVAFMTMRHPLVQVLIATDRQALWRRSSQLLGRIGHAPADDGEDGAAIFLFEGNLQDGAGALVERRLIPVFVAASGVVSTDAEGDARRAFRPRKGEPRAGLAAQRFAWAESQIAATRMEAIRRLHNRAFELEQQHSAQVDESLQAFDAARPKRKAHLLEALGAADPQQDLALTPTERQRIARLKKRVSDFDLTMDRERQRIEARRTIRVASGAGGEVWDVSCLLLVVAEKP